MTNAHTTREGWLVAAMAMLDAKYFDGRGYTLPEKRSCSCGFPKGGWGHSIGQCWGPETSTDGTINMFVCPTQDNPIRVLDILLHELIHAQVGVVVGHKKPFKKMAREFGLEGKATATYATEGTPLWLELSHISEQLGPYPHKAMQPIKKTKERGSMGGWVRLQSPTEETYKVLVSPKMLDEHGVPLDPWGDRMEPVEGSAWQPGGDDDADGE
jgi:hypothetical protein